MACKKQICYYRSGPIERDPAVAFHVMNYLDSVLTEEFGFKITGDTFEFLETGGCPQSEYGPMMKKLRDQGRFYDYNRAERLLKMSFRKTKKADFSIIKLVPEASGGTTSETVIEWLEGIPKLVIIGPHCEGLLDNDSTFMIKMTTDYYALVFNTEKEVIDFVRKHLRTFQEGREAIRRLIAKIKLINPYVNDRPKPLYSDAFAGKTVIIHGRPGVGKGTQARLLQDRAGFKYFGSGHELRKLSSKLPKQDQSLGEGNLAKPVIINYLLTRNLLPWERFEPVVIDGSPKMPEEARALMDLFELLDRNPVVIVIDIDERLSRKRIVQRHNCHHCEISFCESELISGSLCPYCGTALKIRPENINPEAIDNIMGWYQTNVVEAIKFFSNRGVAIHYIDGQRGGKERSKEEIFSDILKILKE